MNEDHTLLIEIDYIVIRAGTFDPRSLLSALELVTYILYLNFTVFVTFSVEPQ